MNGTIVVGSSLTPLYGDLLAAVEAGDAEYVGEHIDPQGVKQVAVRVRPGVAVPNPTIGISQAFFTTVLKDYDDWREKWWREAIQNAIDAGGKDIVCEVIAQPDGTVEVSCHDDGTGMTEDVLINKFLMLGATTKPALSGAAGGFGKAKELLILPWLRWTVHTQDRIATGAGVEYSVRPVAPIKGTRIAVLMPADQHTRASAAIAFIEKCDLPGVKFTVVDIDDEGKVTTHKPRAWLRGTEVLREIPDKAQISLAKVDYEGHYVYVRARGIYMFNQWGGETPKRQILCDLTGPSVELLTANRDGFRDYEIRRELSDLAKSISKDVMSALRSKKGLIRQKFPGTGKFAADRRTAEALASVGPIGPTARGVTPLTEETRRRVAEALEYSLRSQERMTGRAAALPDRDLVLELLSGVQFRGAHHVEQAVRQLSWEPDLFLVNEIEGFRVPKRFFPATMSPRVIKLLRTWTELCRFVMMQLGSFRPFGVGYMFSDTLSATYQPDEDEHWLLLNPYKDLDERKAIWSPTKIDDLRWLYAAAIHECTHLADGIDYHDESFAAALTRNVASTADGFRKVRGIARSIKMSDKPLADVAENPAAPADVLRVREQLLSWSSP